MTIHNSLDLAPEGAWFKSSYSGGSGNSCVEIADLIGTASVVGVRDSKQTNGPAFTISAGTFAGFVASVREGAFSS